MNPTRDFKITEQEVKVGENLVRENLAQGRCQLFSEIRIWIQAV